MSTTPRLPALPPGRTDHPNDPMRVFSTLYGSFWSHGAVDHPTKEIVRLRNARTIDCGF